MRVLSIAAGAMAQPMRAAQILKADEAGAATLAPYPEIFPPSARLLREAQNAARAALGEDAFATAWEQRKALSLVEVCTLALMRATPGKGTA